MPRKKHPNKEIEAALKYAESKGWRIEVGCSHAWGRLYCPFNNAECRLGEFCISSIYSTPRDTTKHARQIRRIVDHCILTIPMHQERL
ncbi:hypothetical protein [Endozoicomonas sp. 2B-B]